MPLTTGTPAEMLAKLSMASQDEAITSLLARCPVAEVGTPTHRTHIMDKRGEGVPVILSRTKDIAGKVPDYRMIDESELLLVVPAAGGS